MCRLYSFCATEPTRVECTLVKAQNALMRQAERDREGYSNAHGWGIAAYHDEGDSPWIVRRAFGAHEDEHFREAAARAHAVTVVAHVRRATVGEPRPENTHPFHHGPWSFAHNGTLRAFPDQEPDARGDEP